MPKDPKAKYFPELAHLTEEIRSLCCWSNVSAGVILGIFDGLSSGHTHKPQSGRFCAGAGHSIYSNANDSNP